MVPLLGLQCCLNELIFTVLILIKNKISELIPIKQIEKDTAHTQWACSRSRHQAFACPWRRPSQTALT